MADEEEWHEGFACLREDDAGEFAFIIIADKENNPIGAKKVDGYVPGFIARIEEPDGSGHIDLHAGDKPVNVLYTLPDPPDWTGRLKFRI